MKCEKIESLIVEYINGGLDSEETRIVDAHISSCETCRTELEKMKSILFKLDDMPLEEPSPNLKKNVDNMIDSYSLGMNNISGEPWIEKVSEWIETWWPKRPLVQFAATVSVLIIGLITGLSIDYGPDSKNEISQLRSDVNDIKQLVINSLLNQSSAVDRINGLTMSSQLKNADPQFFSILLMLLNTDSNVNVRLAAVNALSNFAEDEYVRHELIKSLSLQSSPLVQISLIDLLATIKEYTSSSTLIKIINDPNTNTHVKERAESALKHLI